MRVEAIACGAFANESERLAIEQLQRNLRGQLLAQRWLLLTNLASAVNAIRNLEDPPQLRI